MGLAAVARLQGSDRWLSAAAVATGAAGLGRALELTNGTVSNDAVLWMSVALLMGVLALTSVKLPFLERRGESLVLLVLGGALFYQVGAQLIAPPGVYLGGGASYADHHMMVAVAAILAGALLSGSPWLGKLAFPGLLVVHLALGVWLLNASPRPHIDVFSWTNEALAALGAGKNPFAITMPNIYGNTQWYAPGVADNQRVYMGYPYPPLGLLIGWVGHLVKGDFRYANLACLAAAGALMAYARPGRLGAVVAATFLLTPRLLFVLEQAWTDAYVIFFLAGTVFLACRKPAWVPYAMGLLVVSKQYTVLVAPLALLLLPRPFRWKDLAGFTLKAAGAGLAVTLPFALWDVGAFLNSVWLHSGSSPFRPDALSYIAWTAKDGAPTLPLWLDFAMLVPVYALALLRAPRSPAGFAAACALVFGVFFAFAKHAFCNHHFLVLGALLVAAAAMRPPEQAQAAAGAAPPVS